MAYNNFPATYQPYYPQYQPQSSGSIIWVQGEAGAKSYLVAPNTTVQLWDSEAQVIYLKSADASGMPSMKVLDYTIRSAPQITPNAANNSANGLPEYATKSETDAILAQIANLRKKVDGLTKKKEEDEDE